MLNFKKIKNIIKSLIIIAAAVILVPNFYVRFLSFGKIKKQESCFKDADCILVLGAGLRNGKPSPMLSDRLDAAVSLYKDGTCKKIIMSGDHSGEYYDEVNAMKKYAIEKGANSEDIFMDHAGLSTYDSLYRAKEIFGAEKIIIVTQKYHLYRALYIARKLDITACGVSATARSYSGDLYREAREILARDKDFLKCIIKPKAEISGEKIDLGESGDITNDK